MYININSQFSFSVPLKFSLNICLQIQSTHINFKPPNELFFLIQLTVTSWRGTNAPFLLPTYLPLFLPLPPLLSLSQLVMRPLWKCETLQLFCRATERKKNEYMYAHTRCIHISMWIHSFFMRTKDEDGGEESIKRIDRCSRVDNVIFMPQWGKVLQSCTKLELGDDAAPAGRMHHQFGLELLWCLCCCCWRCWCLLLLLSLVVGCCCCCCCCRCRWLSLSFAFQNKNSKVLGMCRG